MLIVLSALLAGCGSSHPATRLKIEVSDRSGVRAYRLECGPPRGTAPHPSRICADLHRSPNLLVGGPWLDHSCPGSDYMAFRVSGTYTGHAIDATFPPPSCAWAPGQGDAADEWTYLMHAAGPGEKERELGSPPLSSAERAHRRARLRKLPGLVHTARGLAQERLRALREGDLALRRGLPPDSLARRVLELQLAADQMPLRPPVADERVYSTTLGRVEGWRGVLVPDGKRLVYLVVMHFAYRDYRGHKHRDPAAFYREVDARTLEAVGGGGADGMDLSHFGPPVELL
jgi:hypothetical protein